MSHPDPPVISAESPDVIEARKHFEGVIELLDSLRRISTDVAVLRWASIAITQCEIAEMCTVRALTTQGES